MPDNDAARSLIEPLWRAAVIFRIIALAFAIGIVSVNAFSYRDPRLAVIALALMTLWTGFMSWQFVRRSGRRMWVVVADVIATSVLQYSSVWILSDSQLNSSFPTITTVWACGPVIAAGILAGRPAGLLSGLILAAVNIATRGRIDADMGRDAVLLMGLGFLLGLAAATARRSAARLSQALWVEAATAERERLARSIHDGVLQVLARIRSHGSPADLAQAAGEQEVALRRLMSTPIDENGIADLSKRLRSLETQQVQFSLPATPVAIPATIATELTAVVAEALQNATHHGGANAWVLVEDLGESVSLSVRDDGPGIPAGRLGEAESQGRMGIAKSIRGRVLDLGGTIRLETAPGSGTEWEIVVPKQMPAPHRWWD